MGVEKRTRIPFTGVPKDQAERDKQIEKLTHNAIAKRKLLAKPMHAAIETWVTRKPGLIDASVKEASKDFLQRRLKAAELRTARALRQKRLR